MRRIPIVYTHIFVFNHIEFSQNKLTRHKLGSIMAANRPHSGLNRPAVTFVSNSIIVAILLHCLIITTVSIAGQQLPNANPTTATSPTVIASSSCVSKTTCGECLRTRGCAWCSQPNFGDKPRCFAAAAAASVRCDAVVNPYNEMLLIENRKLTKESGGDGASVAGGYAEGSSSTFEHHSASSSSGYSQSSSGHSSSGYSKSVVQISPQRVNLKLRISKYIACYSMICQYHYSTL